MKLKRHIHTEETIEVKFPFYIKWFDNFIEVHEKYHIEYVLSHNFVGRTVVKNTDSNLERFMQMEEVGEHEFNALKKIHLDKECDIRLTC